MTTTFREIRLTKLKPSPDSDSYMHLLRKHYELLEHDERIQKIRDEELTKEESSDIMWESDESAETFRRCKASDSLMAHSSSG